MLASDEEQKAMCSSNRHWVGNLKTDFRQHEGFVKVVSKSTRSRQNPQGVVTPRDEVGVEQLVRELYNLQHFGRNL